MRKAHPERGRDRPESLLHNSEERFRLLVEAVEDYAIFLLDKDGIITSWNSGAQKIKGYTAQEIIGRPFTTFYTEDAIAVGWPQEELRRATELGRFEDEGWRVRKDGSRFWADVVITALYDDHGEVQGFAKITRDLTERRMHEEALRQSEERFRLLVENVRDYAIFMLDTEGRIQSWNAGAQAIKGYSAADVIGRHFSLFYTADDRAAGRPAYLLGLALKAGRAHDEGWRVRKDGSTFWAGVTITPVHDAAGRLRGFAKVTRDMSEHRRLRELEDATRRMSEFLAMLAHELRNPLAPIRNAVSIMQLEPLASQRLRSARDIIDRQLSQMTRLVDDLLEVGRIATGKIHLRRERLSYRELVLSAVEASRPVVEARHHTLVVQVPAEDPLTMMGDRTRLTQVLQNLLNNAAKYTDEHGRIEVHVQADAGSVVTTVSDNGRGIAPDALERIFGLFVQEEANHSPTDSGLGIGLSLTRTLVELHGGSVRAHSMGRNQGATFTVRLPLASSSLVEEEPSESTGEIATTHALHVLVVDDNRDSADTMAGLIQMLGHDARAVYEGEAAVQMASWFRPQVVLLDLNMPQHSGFEVLQRLRALPSPVPMRVVAMTGYGQPSDRERTLNAGFDAHLTKPVGVDQLLPLLNPASAPTNAG